MDGSAIHGSWGHQEWAGEDAECRFEHKEFRDGETSSSADQDGIRQGQA